MAAFLAKIAQQRIHRLAGGARARVHFHHDPCHRGPGHHLGQPITVMDLNAPNSRGATRICVYTYSASLHSICKSWTICQGWHAWSGFYSGYADWWRSIVRFVHYQLRGNAAISHFVNNSALLSEHDSDDESWSKGSRFSSIIMIYN